MLRWRYNKKRVNEFCDLNIKHEILSYNELIKKIKDKDFNGINFEDSKIQKYFIKYLINEDNTIENSSILNKYNKLTKHNITLTKSQIAKIRNKLLDNYNNLTLIELLENIKINVPDLVINIIDIKYDYKEKNKNIEREQRIFLFGTKKRLLDLNHNYTKEVFLDITFKVIPKKFRPYKLMVISGINIKDNKTKLLCLILLKFLDSQAYEKIFRNYKFLFKIDNFNLIKRV